MQLSPTMNKYLSFRCINLNLAEWSDNAETVIKGKGEYIIIGCNFYFLALEVGDVLLFCNNSEDEPFSAGIVEKIDEGTVEEIEEKYQKGRDDEEIVRTNFSRNSYRPITGMVLRKVDVKEKLDEREAYKQSISEEERRENNEEFINKLNEYGF